MPVLGLLVGQLPDSRTTRLLAGMLRTATPSSSTLIELPYFDLPHHAPYEDAPTPRAGLEWKCRLAELDGLVVVTPTHERSLPGALKNALDWAHAVPNSLEGLPVAIAGAARPGAGHFVTLQHLRTVLNDAGAAVMGQPERTLTVDRAHFDAADRCINADLEASAADLMSAAAGYAAFESPRRPKAAAPPATASSLHGASLTTMEARDPLAAVTAVAGPGPQSPAVGIPAPFLSDAITVDPLRETGDPLLDAIASETFTGA